jgi:hypothetical protein
MPIDDETRLFASLWPVVQQERRASGGKTPQYKWSGRGPRPSPLAASYYEAVFLDVERRAWQAVVRIAVEEALTTVRESCAGPPKRGPGRPSRRAEILWEFSTLPPDWRETLRTDTALYATLRKWIMGRGNRNPRGLGETAMKSALRDKLTR